MASLINFRIVGMAALQRALGVRRARLHNRERANRGAIAVVDRWIQQNFREEGKLAHGGKWKPLSKVTLARRRKKGRGAKILQDSGEMRKRWKHLFTRNKVAIQSGVDYATKHQEGDGVPERRIIPFHKQVKDDIKKTYDHFIRKAIK